MPKRVDRNQAEIVEALRRVGVTVQSLAVVGRGVPDLLCGHRWRTVLLEVKAAKGRLTPAQRKWLAAWKGEYYIVCNIAEALAVFGVRS